jgi:hypothetical protein
MPPATRGDAPTVLADASAGGDSAAPEIVAEVEKVRPPYNLGALNQRAALWMLRHQRDWLRARAAEVVAERAPRRRTPRSRAWRASSWPAPARPTPWP